MYLFAIFQNKLKSSQREKVRQFITFTQSGEKTAINCLNIHDWKLDVAVDNYYSNPERYNREPKAAVDRKRVEQIFNRYKGKLLHSWLSQPSFTSCGKVGNGCIEISGA